VSIAASSPVQFNTAGASTGTAITVVSNSTFGLTQTGLYKISFVVYLSALSLLGGLQLQFTGTATPSANTNTFNFLTAGVSLTGFVMFQVTVPGNLQLVATGLLLTLSGSGTNAAIVIEKLA